MRIVACFALILLSGCGSGPALYPIDGTVTLDSKPIEGLMVAFAPEGGGISGAGRTDAAGKYTITSTLGKGLPAGNYNVAIQQAQAVVNTASESQSVETSSNSSAYLDMAKSDPNQYKAAERQREKQNLIPAKYNSQTTLKEIVAKTTNTIDFNLSSK